MLPRSEPTIHKATSHSATGGPKKAARLDRLVLGNAVFLAGLWLFESRVGEAFWLSGALCYLPQHWVPLPTLALLAIALKRRAWKVAGAYALTLATVAHVFLGFQIPLASTLRRATAQEERGRGVRVMSYNILGATRGVERVAAAIREQKPDVIFMQEAVVIAGSGQPDPVAPLHAALPGYNEARAGEVCLFSRFPILAQAQHQLPDGASRFILEAILDVRGTPVRVVNVHPYTILFREPGKRLPGRGLPFRVSHSLSVRNKQIALLLRVLDNPPHAWKPEWRSAPIIMAGDFNTPPRGRTYNALSARLSDSWIGVGWGTGDSYSSSTPLVRIDHVWHSDEWSARRAFNSSSQASDHKALVVDLELRRAST